MAGEEVMPGEVAAPEVPEQVAVHGGEGVGFRYKPVVVDDKGGEDASHYVVPETYRPAVQKVLLSGAVIRARAAKLAADIAAHPLYNEETGRPPHVICVLKGAFPFFADLTRALSTEFLRKSPGPASAAGSSKGEGAGSATGADYTYRCPYTTDFMRAKSYDGTESTGDVKISALDESAVRGRHVILVEDIVDTGTTLTAVIPKLLALGATSVRTCAMLEKRTDKCNGFRATFVGFSIPDAFVIGYGLDLNEAFRDLDEVAVINPAVVPRYISPVYGDVVGRPDAYT